jgi:putative transcriptional regulator
MKKKYQSEQLMVCHESAQALYEIGAITEAEMRKFDEDCLVHEPTPKAPSAPKPLATQVSGLPIR